MEIFREDEGTDGVMLQAAWKCEVKHRARICVGKTLGVDAGYGERRQRTSRHYRAFSAAGFMCWPLPRLLCRRLSSGSVCYW